MESLAGGRSEELRQVRATWGVSAPIHRHEAAASPEEELPRHRFEGSWTSESTCGPVNAAKGPGQRGSCSLMTDQREEGATWDEICSVGRLGVVFVVAMGFGAL